MTKNVVSKDTNSVNSLTKNRDPTNLIIRNDYHTALKIYKDTLEMKRNKFQNDKLIELEKAAENNAKSFWKSLQNSSEELDSNVRHDIIKHVMT